MSNQSSLSNHAEKTFFEKESRTIYNQCLKKAQRWHNHPRYFEPQDLAEFAFIKVWMAMDKYDESQPLAAFVNTIAFNAFVDACRSNGGVYEVSLDETLPPASTTLQGKVVCSVVDRNEHNDTENRPAYSIESESSSIALALEPLLGCLPTRQRQVIEMSFGLGQNWWERTDESIAEELGITRQTVISDRKKAILDMQTRVGRIGVWAA